MNRRRGARASVASRPGTALRHAVVPWLALAAWACTPGSREQERPADDAQRPPPDPGALAIVRAESVQTRAGPGGQPFEVALRVRESVAGHARRIGTRTFEIALRSDERTSFPCSACHGIRGTILRSERTADAHGNIQPVHPAESGATCATCHAASSVERLALTSGETISLDHAYRLCAQCHFAQVNDWAGGAHGKRLDGWRGRRVVMGCTDCHDPHRPAVGQRIPFPGPRIPAQGGHQP